VNYYAPTFDEPSAPASPIPALTRLTAVLFWLVAATSLAITVTTWLRRSAWSDAVGLGPTSANDLTEHDPPVIIAVFVLTMLVVCTAVAVAAWAMRLGLSAQARGIEGVSVAWAIAGWFVPVGFLFLGFRQVVKVVRGSGASVTGIYVWQAAFAVTAIVMSVAQATSTNLPAIATDDAVSTMTREVALSAASTVLFALSALFGGRAIRHADAAVTTLPVR